MSSTPKKSVPDLGWRTSLLQNFTPDIASSTRLTVVADPDHILSEQTILCELRRRGFDLIAIEDHVAFRLAYESRYRRVWDQGENTNLVVVLRSPSGNFNDIPYDLLTEARDQHRCLSFSVGELFPTLAPNIVLNLDRDSFDDLYVAANQQEPMRLGEDATKDFILRHVFAIAPELIKTPAGLLHVLLQRHYRARPFPPALDDRFVSNLQRTGRWDEWPLQEIVPSHRAFMGFLQERWPHFLRQSSQLSTNSSKENDSSHALHYGGPADIPFGHDDVKIYIDNLFQEGQLKPSDDFNIEELPEPWMHAGVVSQASDSCQTRFEPLTERITKELPDQHSSYRDWINYARVWAEWSALRWSEDVQISAEDRQDCDQIHDEIERHFADWMLQNYASLHNVSYYHRPAMVHHVAHHMAQAFAKTGSQSTRSGQPCKYAMIVVDGLAMDQWIHLRDACLAQIKNRIDFEEDGCFAWVPTLTGVSRQAIFAGTEPLLFEASLGATAKEPIHWKRFWEDRGARRAEIGYVKEGKAQDDEDFLKVVLEAASHPKMRMLGIVASKLDQAMHGVQTGSGGMHAVVRQWAREGYFPKMIKALLDLNYEIVLTSDHGNIHGVGMGKPNVGSVADERGERAHVFPDTTTCDAVKAIYPDAISWPHIGLPTSWNVLLAPGRKAFVREGTQTLGHGGISMEEVIVPFVKIRKQSS